MPVNDLLAKSPGAKPAVLPLNLIGAEWTVGDGSVTREIRNPADQKDVVAAVKEASLAQVDAACNAAAKAFPAWAATPAPDRARVLFNYHDLLSKHFDEIARLLVKENGKLISEARGSVRRGIDVVEYATGIPQQIMGKTHPNVSRNVDSYDLCEPLGVCVGIPPFNFPAMIPMWMMPIAVACGNPFILKPAEKAPLCGTRLVELFVEAGAPAGVISVVQGGREVSERLIDNAHVKAITFVGSSAVAKSVYQRASAAGKRVQALGGGKNHLLVMPDADLEQSIPALVASCYGCAGQRCLAGSVVVAIGDKAQQDKVVDAFVKGAKGLKLGDGLDESTSLCPVVNPESKQRIESFIEKGVKEGAKLVLDGRNAKATGRPDGCFVGATVFDNVTPEMEIQKAEIFGPVVTVIRAKDINEAIDLANKSEFGNSASLFSTSGKAARIFRERIQCGMLGVNLGVPAPMSMFSFGGWKNSLYGDTHVFGTEGVRFYTKKKVVTERWFGAEAPKDGWV